MQPANLRNGQICLSREEVCIESFERYFGVWVILLDPIDFAGEWWITDTVILVLDMAC